MPADFGWRGAVAPSPCARADPPENPTRTRRANPTRGRVSRSPVAGQSPFARGALPRGEYREETSGGRPRTHRGGHDARRASSQPQRSRLRDHRGYFLVVLGIGAVARSCAPSAPPGGRTRRLSPRRGMPRRGSPGPTRPDARTGQIAVRPLRYRKESPLGGRQARARSRTFIACHYSSALNAESGNTSRRRTPSIPVASCVT
jgi:hypothetical protein